MAQGRRCMTPHSDHHRAPSLGVAWGGGKGARAMPATDGAELRAPSSHKPCNAETMGLPNPGRTRRRSPFESKTATRTREANKLHRARQIGITKPSGNAAKPKCGRTQDLRRPIRDSFKATNYVSRWHALDCSQIPPGCSTPLLASAAFVRCQGRTPNEGEPS